MGVRRRFEVLALPDFRRLFVGRTASLVGDGIAPVALAFAVLDLTGSATDLGFVLAAHEVVFAALVLAGGVYADRLSPRLAMLGADLVRVVSTGAIAVLLLAGVAEVWELVVLYAVAGAGSAFFNPGSGALVPSLVPAPQLQDANALLNFSRSAGQFAGPAIAGVVLAIGAPGWALAIDAATFAISATFLVRLTVRHVPAPAAESFFADLRGGWSEFRVHDWLWGIVVAAAIVNAIYFPAFQVLGPTVAKTELGGSDAWALIAAAAGLGAILGAGLSLVFRPSRPLLASETLIPLMALPIALLALPAASVVIALGAFVAGLTSTFANVIWESTWVQHVPEAALSRVSSYDWFGSLALQPIGLALVGPLAAGAGLGATLWIAAGLIFGCQLLLLVSIPSIRRLRAGPGPATVRPLPVDAGE